MCPVTESGVSSGSPSDVGHSAEDSDPEVPGQHHHHNTLPLHAAIHHHKERTPLKRVVSEPATGVCPPPPPPPMPAADFHRQMYVYVQQQSARNQSSSEYTVFNKNIIIFWNSRNFILDRVKQSDECFFFSSNGLHLTPNLH